jgi:hypothetical protein
MRTEMALAVVLSLGVAATAGAQEVTPAPTLDVGTTEWMVTAGPALGVTVFNSSAGHRYFLQSLSWGRILTSPHAPGLLRGRFQWSVEFIPLFGQYRPQHTYGFGVTPLLWRWNFEPHGRLAPFAELAGGALFTRDPIPADTTTANFTAHVSYGVRYFMTPHASVVASYRFHHISNGNRLERNPGVNAHVLQFGVSVLRPH